MVILLPLLLVCLSKRSRSSSFSVSTERRTNCTVQAASAAARTVQLDPTKARN